MTEGERRTKKAIIRVWAEGGKFTSYEIAKATAGIYRPDPIAPTTVRRYLSEWQENGTADLQECAQRSGKTSWRFHWGPLDATFADILTHAFDTFTESDRRRLATAVRGFFGRRRGSKEKHLVKAARGIPAEDLYGLPAQVSDHALQGGLAVSTAYNYRSVVKRALEEAALVGLVAVVFPKLWEEDSPWEAALYRWFREPRDSDVQQETLRVYETYVRRCGEVVQEKFPEVTPEDLTEKQLEEVVFPHIKGVMGVPTLPSNIRSALYYVARVHGEGPYRDDEVPEGGRRTCDGYLKTKEGKAGTGDPTVFLKMLEEHGFDDSVLEFFKWYFDYSTLSEDEFWLRDDEFPARPAKRVLSQSTVNKRLIAARAFAYQALRVAEEKDTPLDLVHVFGVNGETTAKYIELWWRQRAGSGEVASRSSWGLEDILKSVGMIARGAYDRWLHERGRETARNGSPLSSDEVRKDLADKSDEAQGYWRVYDHCRNRMDMLQDRRRKSEKGHVATDIKDIRRIYKNTPPAYWVAIQDALLDRLASWKRKKGFEYHRQVALVFLNGVLLSTGVRISEPAWIKLGEGGYDPSTRLLTWAAWMRKNEKKHSAFIRERFCPAWLERVYLEESRPFLMRRGIKRGKLDKPHDFLMVRSSDGNSWSKGWWPSTEEDRRDCHDRISSQVGSIRKSWQSLLAGTAAELGLLWPTVPGEGGPHTAVRNSFAFGIFLLYGEEAAAHYLGDSVESVRETYASTDGVHVDVTDLTLQPLGDLKAEGEPTEMESEGASVADLLEKLEKARTREEELEQRLRELESLTGMRRAS